MIKKSFLINKRMKDFDSQLNPQRLSHINKLILTSSFNLRVKLVESKQ